MISSFTIFSLFSSAKIFTIFMSWGEGKGVFSLHISKVCKKLQKVSVIQNLFQSSHYYYVLLVKNSFYNFLYFGQFFYFFFILSPFEKIYYFFIFVCFFFKFFIPRLFDFVFVDFCIFTCFKFFNDLYFLGILKFFFSIS